MMKGREWNKIFSDGGLHEVFCHSSHGKGKEHSKRPFGSQNSDAVAPVVALMLLLAVVATFISLYSTGYLPGLKEQSEIAQISEVKEVFMEFSGDIKHLVNEKKSVSYDHMVQLGAGDIIMSPEKSSGTLTVEDMGPIVEILTAPGDPVAASGMVKVEFKPSYSFWEGQGYNWQYGYINVTKKDIEVPLTDFTMDDVITGNEFSTFAESFIDFEDESVLNASSGEYELKIKMEIADLVPGENSFVSGNSATMLGILSEEKDELEFNNTDYLSFRFASGNDDIIMNEFSGHLFDKTEEYLNGLHTRYPALVPLPVNTSDTITLDGLSSTMVVIVPVEISISAY